MSQENVEIVRRMWDAFLGDDRKGFSDPEEALEAAGLSEQDAHVDS